MSRGKGAEIKEGSFNLKYPSFTQIQASVPPLTDIVKILIIASPVEEHEAQPYLQTFRPL